MGSICSGNRDHDGGAKYVILGSYVISARGFSVNRSVSNWKSLARNRNCEEENNVKERTSYIDRRVLRVATRLVQL